MSPSPLRTTVLRTSRLSDHMVRVVVGGDELAGFTAGEFTDHYVKLKLTDRDGTERTRTYSVSAWDAESHELTIDFVVHGDTGVAGLWALGAQPGDELRLLGPGGAYAPDPAAAWHLMVGDASVLPAIGASLPRVPSGAPVFVVVELEDPEEAPAFDTPGDLRLTVLRADGSAELLRDAVAALDLPDGPGCAFVHGEASATRLVRTHLVAERGLPKEGLSASGYWKRSRDEEGWRDDKAEWNRLAELEASGEVAGAERRG